MLAKILMEVTDGHRWGGSGVVSPAVAVGRFDKLTGVTPTQPRRTIPRHVFFNIHRLVGRRVWFGSIADG